MNARRTRLPLAAGAIVLGSMAVTIAAPSLPNCATPELTAPDAVQGSSNTVEWTQPEGSLEGAGFILEVASTSTRDTDGSLLDVERSIGDIPSSARSYTFDDLSEGEHWYAIRAKNKPVTCHSSSWSEGEVSTVQDSTGPEVAITSPEDGHIFLLETVTIAGTLIDAGSGPDTVTVTLTNTTPVVAETLGQPDALTVDAATGLWTATFSDVLPGLYHVTATGVDKVGNESETPAEIDVIVTVTTNG